VVEVIVAGLGGPAVAAPLGRQAAPP